MMIIILRADGRSPDPLRNKKKTKREEAVPTLSLEYTERTGQGQVKTVTAATWCLTDVKQSKESWRRLGHD